MEEILKCELCNTKFNLDNKRPLTVKCGHSYCAACIMETSNNQKKNKTHYCPHCKAPYLLNFESCIPNLKLEEIIKFIFNIPKQLIYIKPGAKRNQSPSIPNKMKTQYNCCTYPKGYQPTSTSGFGNFKQNNNRNYFDEEKNNFGETIETIPALEDDEGTTLNISFKDDCKELFKENLMINKGMSNKNYNDEFIKNKGKKLKEIPSIKNDNMNEFDCGLNKRKDNNIKQIDQQNNEIKIKLKSQLSTHSILNNSNIKDRVNTMPNNNNNENSTESNNNVNLKISYDDERLYKINIKNKTNNNSNNNLSKNQKSQINMTPQTHNPFKPKMICLQKKTNLFVNNYPFSNTLPTTNSKIQLYTPYKHSNPFDKSNSNEINKTFQKLKNELMLYLQPSLSKQHSSKIQKYEEQIYKTLTHPKFKDNLSSLTIRLLPPQELYIGNSSYGVVYSSNGEYHEGKINLW